MVFRFAQLNQKWKPCRGNCDLSFSLPLAARFGVPLRGSLPSQFGMENLLAGITFFAINTSTSVVWGLGNFEPIVLKKSGVSLKWPSVFFCCISLKSSLSRHCFPFPVYPALHKHVWEPTVFWQTALTSQLSELAVHSFISENEQKRDVISMFFGKRNSLRAEVCR